MHPLTRRDAPHKHTHTYIHTQTHARTHIHTYTNPANVRWGNVRPLCMQSTCRSWRKNVINRQLTREIALWKSTKAQRCKEAASLCDLPISRDLSSVYIYTPGKQPSKQGLCASASHSSARLLESALSAVFLPRSRWNRCVFFTLSLSLSRKKHLSIHDLSRSFPSFLTYVHIAQVYSLPFKITVMFSSLWNLLYISVAKIQRLWFVPDPPWAQKLITSTKKNSISFNVHRPLS